MGYIIKSRAISEMVAILIVVTILVGVAVAVALMTGAFVQRVRPSGASLVITGATARKVSNNRAVVTLSLQNTGSEAINKITITVYDEAGTTMTPTLGSTPTSIQPNQIVTVGFSVSGSVIKDYSTIYIVVNYTTVTNNAGSTSQSVIVMPS